MGKTLLASLVAADLADDLPDGAVFVELAELREPDLLANTVAVALGLRGQAGAEGKALVDHLRGRHLLLVLDNCEHLVEACCDLAGAVLRECPDVIVLATSRQSLGAAGERLFPLMPFAVPDPDALRSAADLAGYDAVSLLLDRGQAVVPTFEVTEDNFRDVARVVRALDGLPLAIELAAVRLRSLSVRQLADRLADKLTLLTRPVLRQRSLHATLDWSYDLCTPDEQRVWAAASVFAGSFDLAAAEHVCGADPDATLEVVDGLVDKSVLIARESDGVIRYHMLETLREYGAERLSDADTARLRRLHRDHFAGLAAGCRLRPAGRSRSLCAGACGRTTRTCGRRWSTAPPPRARRTPA
ncbi:ATP-binding protein [Actinokineospora soli]|uniref:ATP-binding protein n=1 Tax=Actinokineospora soli TaxID=1048753 RepID=A0ABW2TJD7_9PSEU